MTVYLKVLHIASLVIWCGGLLALPALFANRHRAETDPQLWHLQAFSRFLYTMVVSPAAFLAVVAGTALIFTREVFTVWFALKLLAVGMLVVIHVRMGFVIVNVFDEGRSYRPWRFVTATTLAAATMSAILWLVLVKPAIDLGPLPEWAVTPGGLQSLSETMMPTP